MLISKVKIKSFLSILEEEFHLQPDITALAGGNESGKSNIVKALIAFFREEEFLATDKHQLGETAPEITIHFTLTEEEQARISEITSKKAPTELEVRKTGSSKKVLNIHLPKEDKDKKALPVVPEEAESTPVPTDVSSTPAENPEPTEALPQPSVQEDTTFKKVVPNPEAEILSMLPVLVPVQSRLDLIVGSNVEIKELRNAKGNPTGELSSLNDFLELGDVDLHKLSGRKLSFNEKTKYLISCSSKIGKKLRKYWPQENLKILMATDRQKISVLVRDGGFLPELPKLKVGMSKEQVKWANKNLEDREDDSRWIWTNLEERSDGFRWLTTFYAKYLSKLETGKNIFMVIDDLGIYLNASIQENLLNELKRLTKGEAQLVYTTHSPYMLDFRNDENILLVEKKRRGTKVYDDWLKNRPNKGLPQPLKDIGASRSGMLLGRRNLLVEGGTDVKLIKRLAVITDTSQEVRNKILGVVIYPGGGAGELVGLSLYCGVDNKKAAILFDSDDKGLSEKQKADSYGLISKDVHSLAMPYEQTSLKIETIEDLVPHRIFVKALNEVGEKVLKDKWMPITSITRKWNNHVFGIIAAVKKRLKNESLTDTDIELLINSKKAILESSLNSLSLTSYDSELLAAVKNFLTNLSELIWSA